MLANQKLLIETMQASCIISALHPYVLYILIDDAHAIIGSLVGPRSMTKLVILLIPIEQCDMIPFTRYIA